MFGNFIKGKQYHIEPYGIELSEFKYNFALQFYSFTWRCTELTEKMFKITLTVMYSYIAYLIDSVWLELC